MKTICRFITKSTLLICIIAFSAICYHSIEEIHYLKTFFPKSFTVEQAFYASGIELIKIIIVGIPVVLTVSILLSLFRCGENDNN